MDSVSQSSSTRRSSATPQTYLSSPGSGVPSSLGEGLHLLSDFQRSSTPPLHKLSTFSSPLVTSFLPSDNTSPATRGYSYNETSISGATAGAHRRTSEVVGPRPPPPAPPHRTCSSSGAGGEVKQLENEQKPAQEDAVVSSASASSVPSLPTTSGVSVGGGSSSFTR